jgi:uncharacterized protein (TIGR02246 family)
MWAAGPACGDSVVYIKLVGQLNIAVESFGRRHMNTRRTILAIGLCLISAAALAGPKEDVTAATAKWGEVLAQQNPDSVTALYAKDGVLWGTLSPTIRSGPEAIRAYFVAAYGALPQIKVSFGEQLVRVYGNTAINSGYYTFSYVKDGEAKTLPARYSLTYVKDGDAWMIVDHHSSGVPAPSR